MGLFKRKSPMLGEGDLLKGFTDAHCHLLPGVDDGVKTLDETLAILSIYEELGIASVWCTPHVMEDVPNDNGSLMERFNALCAAYKGPITLHLSAEYMMDGLFERRLASGDLLPFHGDYLLVETSTFNPPVGMREMLYKIQTRGYTPILAHPERYVYMEEHEYGELLRLGVKLQMNLGSPGGLYGEHVRKRALRLLGQGAYSLAGSDCHSMRMLDMILEGRLDRVPSFGLQ